MTVRLAILAGAGSLPQLLAKARPDALLVGFEGVDRDAAFAAELVVSYERLGEMFEGLREHGISEVVFAGGLARPALDPSRFDPVTLSLLPRIVTAMQGGDDALLRTVFSVFEENGFRVRGAHEVLPALTASAGLLVGPDPSEADRGDAARAREVLDALGPLDVGQGAVVARRLVLGIETAQGTDAMLKFVSETADALRKGAKGVLVKGPKPGQDLRIDMPAIGPGTVQAVQAAGLAGIVIDAGAVLLIERDALLAAAEEAGIFVLAEDR